MGKVVDKVAFGNWLTDALIRWKLEHKKDYGREPSDKDFCRKTGIGPTSFTVWKSGTHLPASQRDIDAMANELGEEVYDQLGQNRRMPRELIPFAAVYRKIKSPERRSRLLEIAKQLEEEERANGDGDGRQAI